MTPRESSGASKASEGFLGRTRRRLFLLALAFILLWSVVPVPAAWIEAAYVHGVYRGVARLLVPLTAAVPFSLSALLVLLLPLGFVAGWWRAFVRARRQGEGRWRAFWWGPRALAFVLVLGYAAFLLLWGAGYRRPAIEDRLGLQEILARAEDVKELGHRIMGVIRRDVPQPGSGDTASAMASLRDALIEVSREWDGVSATLPDGVKTLPDGVLLSLGVTGMISPFLLEAHVDGAVPKARRLAVGAHELAHLAGYCGEADADLASFAAGLRAGDPYARYAVALAVFVDLEPAMRRADREALRATLPEVARADLHAAATARRRYRIASVAHISSRVYDGYLKAQGVAAGVGDYSRGVRLLVRAWRKGLIEVPPAK